MIVCILPTGEWAEIDSENLPAFINVPDSHAELLHELDENIMRDLACGAKMIADVIRESEAL